MRNRFQIRSLAGALVLAAALAVSAGAPAVAAEPQAAAVKSTFNPNACLVLPGWNNTYKIVKGVKYRLFGDTTLRDADPLGRPCPVGIWKKV
ncbi:hypothetical protein [Microbacterium sp. BF1]|uniref:hypothetical protein n=1 Tax=Microbacterium sp. BF1 TaxID=2821146 RepID=UPI001C4E1CFE|nr:hypothetical protein [Microbacterium sp. BF1]